MPYSDTVMIVLVGTTAILLCIVMVYSVLYYISATETFLN